MKPLSCLDVAVNTNEDFTSIQNFRVHLNFRYHQPEKWPLNLINEYSNDIEITFLNVKIWLNALPAMGCLQSSVNSPLNPDKSKKKT